MANLDQPEIPATNHRPPSMVNNRPKLMYMIYAGALLMMYNPLVQVLRWKYKGRKETPFETQSFLFNTSIIAFLIAGSTLTLSLRYYLTSSTRKPFSPLLYRTINIVFSVSAVVAHVALVLILIVD